ncbi:hypothetical protein B0H13DRAFT_1906717 [Mycena leptocephala]|nr:hypothetical protein B0H13DRAFT_1906717 [Mycena leptocephala]
MDACLWILLGMLLVARLPMGIEFQPLSSTAILLRMRWRVLSLQNNRTDETEEAPETATYTKIDGDKDIAGEGRGGLNDGSEQSLEEEGDEPNAGLSGAGAEEVRSKSDTNNGAAQPPGLALDASAEDIAIFQQVFPVVENLMPSSCAPETMRYSATDDSIPVRNASKILWSKEESQNQPKDRDLGHRLFTRRASTLLWSTNRPPDNFGEICSASYFFQVALILPMPQDEKSFILAGGAAALVTLHFLRPEKNVALVPPGPKGVRILENVPDLPPSQQWLTFSQWARNIRYSLELIFLGRGLARLPRSHFKS